MVDGAFFYGLPPFALFWTGINTTISTKRSEDVVHDFSRRLFNHLSPNPLLIEA